jgi:tungstate transport system ATP-binding protein
MTESNLIYELRAIQHGYGSRRVLDFERLDVRRGETLAIIGPSGSGKSTLLRLLQFIERPVAGRIVFDGRVVDGEPPLALRRRVTTVFQRPLLLDRSVRDNVAYGLRLRGRREGQTSAEHLIDRLGLTELARAPARALSGGEMQRVALARALACEPDVLLLDEPTANLDPYNVGLIEDIIGDQRQRGATIVLVTHHVFQARRLADRIGLLLSGRLVEVAPAPELLNAPRDARTRAFLSGEMVY